VAALQQAQAAEAEAREAAAEQAARAAAQAAAELSAQKVGSCWRSLVDMRDVGVAASLQPTL